MSVFTARFFAWLSGGLGLALALALTANIVLFKDRDAKVKEIERLGGQLAAANGTITSLRRDVRAVQKFDTADAEAAAQVCGSDVSAALARGITLGRSICVAQSQGAVQ